jgi:rubrerythrin
MARAFKDLSPKEVLALAVGVERANTERFRAFAGMFRGYDEAVAERFEELAREEEEHERLLLEQFQRRFGQEMPAIDETDVRGVIESPDMDDGEHLIFGSLNPVMVYQLALQAEVGAQEFYRRAADGATDPALSSLYKELADMEDDHRSWLEERLKASDDDTGAQ